MLVFSFIQKKCWYRITKNKFTFKLIFNLKIILKNNIKKSR